MKTTLILILIGLVLYQAASQTDCKTPVQNCAKCAVNGTACLTCSPGFLDYQGTCLSCNISQCDHCKVADKC